VALKLETGQVTNSFKARGALNAAVRLAEARGPGATIVTASAGNHGRAVAWAAERLGLHAVVFTPRDAPAAKREAIRRHGADLRDEAQSYDEAERRAQEYAEQTGDPYISPYDHPDVIAGAGTIAVELIEDDPALEAVVVPVGGGGLASGMAVALAALRPSAAIIAVEAARSMAFSTARREGRMTPIEVGPTIADGISGNVDPKTITWPFVRDLVTAVASVPEGALRRAVRDLAAEEHVIAEGAGVAGVAAVAGGYAELGGRRTAVVLSGANIDVERLAELLRGAPEG
jgi:threonine dehydratase